jgi:hypothetical protein
MYINKIDELIDKVINDFANKLLNKNQLFEKIKKESNFVKFQPEINKLMKEYILTINPDEINAITNNAENKHKIIEFIKRYLAYYLFLAIGYFYDGKPETFINNIIEFTRNQGSFGYKIDNFFNSENNAGLIAYFELLKNTVFLLGLESSKLGLFAKKKEFITTIQFLNSYGQGFVVNNFKLSSLNNDKNVQAHNIIKTLILDALYLKQEKQDVFNILDAVEKQEGTYIFIDIVVPRTQQIDFNMIEKVLTDRQMKEGMAGELYDFLMSHENKKEIELSPDQKILFLINSGFFIPITEDFLLYHKDSEKYEKAGSQNIPKSKKKEDTKIRYIVSKIDSVSEYYSDNVKKNPEIKKNIEKQLYIPLIDRMAVLINEVEEVNIINKLHNQGRRSLENNEFYNDLMSFRQYPYQNFKEFNNHGFSITVNKTIDAVRSVSFNKDGVKRRENLQLRIGADGQVLNIVGFMIPPQHQSVHCLTSNLIKSVTDHDKKKKNGFDATVEYFRKYILGQHHNKPVIWMFNPDTDVVKFDQFIQVSKMNPHENLKLIVSKLYDDLMKLLIDHIQTKLKKIKSSNFYTIFKTINNIENNFFPVPKNLPYWNDVLVDIYHHKYIKVEPKYDDREDKFFGLFGDIIKLPDSPPIKKPKSMTIRIRQEYIEYVKEEEITEAQKVGAVCQHNITWEKIYTLRKGNPNQFNNLLFEFIQRYVIESHEQEYVCKSCGTLINIKKYIPDGMYDNESERFVTFNMPMEVQLEDLPEYDKYKLGIRTIDKLIERITNIGNISYYVGNSVAVKIRRRGVVKNVIDMAIVHNKIINKYYRQRNEKTEQLYGVSKDLTNLFVFELEDGIFVYSSKERDYYKHIKHNNIVVYIILNILIELNKTQILFMMGDKICNYYWYEKMGHYLFNNIKIIVNNRGDTDDIKKYPVLCYLIYLMGCFMAKYNIWYYDAPENSDEKQSKNKTAVIIQKIFIHTFVDVLNSILEISGKNKESHYLYEITQTKFYLRLRTLFNDDSIGKYLSQIEQKKIVTVGDKRKYVVTKMTAIQLQDQFTEYHYDQQVEYPKYVNRIYYMKTKSPYEPQWFSINNITNSPSGKFNNWVAKNKTLISEETGQDIANLKLNTNESAKSEEGYHIILLNKLASKYCLNGDTHNFNYDSVKKNNVCKRCGYMDTDKIKSDDLFKLGEIIRKTQIERTQKHRQKIIEKQEKNKKNMNITNQFIGQLKQDYSHDKNNKTDYFGFVDKFINDIQEIIGSNQLNKKIFLRHNAYIIDHDQFGHTLDTPIIISDNDNKMNFKENHPFFKTNVIFYTNLKSGRIDVFYNAVTHVLLGYKEVNRDFVSHIGSKKYIKIKYSLRERLLLLGYPSKYINIEDQKAKMKGLYKEQSDELLKKIISDIGRNRIINLKSIIRSLQRSIYQVKYNFTNYIPVDDDDRTGDLLDQYRKRIQKMTLKDNKGEHKVFKKWKEVVDNIFFSNLDKKVINLDPEINYVSINDLNNYDSHGNLILFYIIREMSLLLNHNENKVTKLHLINLLVDLINHYHELYNQEEILYTVEMKRFKYKLKTQGFLYDIDQQGHGLDDTVGPYNEYKDETDSEDPDKEEEDYDNNESMMSLDVETNNEDEPDYEGEDVSMARMDEFMYTYD